MPSQTGSQYLSAFEAGALAAIDYIAEQWPHLAEPSDDFPGVTMATAEHIGEIIDQMKKFNVR